MCTLKNGLFILSAYQETCLKPCTDVEYTVSSSKHLTDLSLLPYLTGCPEGQTFAEISFRRKMEIETVRKSHSIVWGRCHLISLEKGKLSSELNDVFERTNINDNNLTNTQESISRKSLCWTLLAFSLGWEDFSVCGWAGRYLALQI